MSDRIAALVVRGRVVVLVGWIAAAVALSMLLPSIREAQVGSLGDLVPVDAAAIDAEKRAAELFAFPLLSRTVAVTRNREGLPILDQGRLTLRAIALNRGQLTRLTNTRGYLLSNSIIGPPAAREQRTTMLFPLLFRPREGQAGRNGAGERFVADHLRPALSDGYAGLTGAIPARAAQADVIEDKLPLVELATVLFVLAAVGLYLRSVLAPLVNLAAVAIAYLVSIRLVAALGEAIGVSVPSEVQPVIVALLFGVVTDYSLFYLSRYRRRLRDGLAPRDAARRTAAELLPVIVTCALAVAAACAALLVADLGFLQAFGPGMAMSVLVALAVSVTFVPAAMALLGGRLFWPSRPRPDTAPAERAGRGLAARVVRRAVERPRRTIAASVAVLTVMSSGVLWLDLGNPLMRGLPPDSPPRIAYAQAAQGFVPGAISPTTLIVERDGVAARRDALARLQRLLTAEAGVAAAFGPATNPVQLRFGAVLARNGDAARYVLLLRADPLGAGAIARLRILRDRLPGLLDRAGLAGVRASWAGDTALSQETVDDTVDNAWKIVPAVFLAVMLVLVAFLRGLVAPLYLVAAAALGPLAALGLAVVLFQWIFDHGGLTYYVPVTAGVLLVALGSDYNIFLVGRVWAEARRRDLDAAIVEAGAGAARAISAAGIVLAVSFGAMALVPIRPFQELAFVMGAGLLIDAFIVRMVLVPAVIALVGYRSGWPGRRLQRRGERAERVTPA